MKRTVAAVVVSLAVPSFAAAEPRVTAQEIIDHFTGQASGPARTRGLVFGDPDAPADRSVFIGPTGFGSDQAAGAGSAAVPPTGVGDASGEAADPGGYDLLIEFDLDSASLRDDSRRHLDAFVDALRSPALAGRRFLVEGHTDATGPADYNLELSRRRAASVVDYLVSHGVEGDRLTPRGFGEARPRVGNPGHPSNRRVETRLAH